MSSSLDHPGHEGAGDMTTPTLINLLCYCFVPQPPAWLLAHRTSMGVDGAFLAVRLYGS